LKSNQVEKKKEKEAFGSTDFVHPREKNKKKKSLDLITIYLRLQLALIGQTFEADLIERIGGVTVVVFLCARVMKFF
jgi:hypothetical protein